MSTPDQAIAVLLEAEDRLAALIREGLEEHRYDDVASIAEVTQRFSEFIRDLDGAHPPARKPPAATGMQTSRQKRRADGKSGPRQLSAAQRAAYPKFRRDGDRLVKVGWSRKGRKEYEQRTPIDVVWTFSAILEGREDAGSIFVMDDLLPLTDGSGKELPSYQAYLVLAWLRDTGVVSKNGRDGYRADPSQLGKDHLKVLWDEVPELGAQDD